MDAIEFVDAQAHLSELLDRVEAGEAIDISRQGRLVARLTAITAPRKAIDLARLQAFTATLPRQARTAGDLIRSMRDNDRG